MTTALVPVLNLNFWQVMLLSTRSRGIPSHNARGRRTVLSLLVEERKNRLRIIILSGARPT